MDDIVNKIKAVNLGCHVSLICTSIFLYALPILCYWHALPIVLLAPTVSGLQQLLYVCEKELEQLDMKINVSKSMCIRFGPRFNVDCAELTSLYGGALKWVNSCRYLGVYFESGRTLKFSFSNAKASFYRAFNAMYGKIGRLASEDIILQLLRAKCMPVLLYATEVCQMLSYCNRTDFVGSSLTSDDMTILSPSMKGSLAAPKTDTVLMYKCLISHLNSQITNPIRLAVGLC